VVEHCLYGVEVYCDFDLFDRPVSLTAVAPGEHPGLQLRQQADGDAMPETCPLGYPIFSNHGRDLVLLTDRELARSEPGQPWCLEVQGVVRFHWAGDAPIITYELLENGSRQLLVFWFVHIFLPLHLTLERGYDFIHSAAVEIEGQPVLFIAPSTGGKSTLGDYFLKRGHAMLSDDKVATFLHEGRFWAVPSHPHHRPYREFEVLGYPVERFATSARPIHAFYLLEPDEPDSDIVITEVQGFRKFEQLLPNYLFGFGFLKEQRLHWLAGLADQSQLFRVRRPWSLGRMQEVYDAVCEHSQKLAVVPGD
jgi:hypothetical protein